MLYEVEILPYGVGCNECEAVAGVRMVAIVADTLDGLVERVSTEFTGKTVAYDSETAEEVMVLMDCVVDLSRWAWSLKEALK